MKHFCISSLLIFLGLFASAQTGYGFKFATWINHFYRAETIVPQLIDGNFSHAAVGGFYRLDRRNGELEVGLQYFFKPQTNVPLVAQDFKGGHQTAYQGGQIDFWFGPRFKMFRPKTGYVLGYRTSPTGFLEPGISSRRINQWFLFLPLGLTVDFPTSFGSVGGGLFYQIGMTNVLANPDPTSTQSFDGGKQRALHFEITVLYGKEKSKPVKNKK
ncbi:MAG: hypothetical protein EBS07_09035 [Sphingobacteriia bacterium]|nr:hypothetical protein [Sphingobacteriia bacterium]